MRIRFSSLALAMVVLTGSSVRAADVKPEAVQKGVRDNIAVDVEACQKRQLTREFIQANGRGPRRGAEQKAIADEAKIRGKAAGMWAETFYSEDATQRILNSGDPKKAQMAAPQKGVVNSRLGPLAVTGNAGWLGLTGRIENLVFTDAKATIMLQAMPPDSMAVYLPYKDGKADTSAIRVIWPQWDQPLQAWVLKSPGAGYVQLLYGN